MGMSPEEIQMQKYAESAKAVAPDTVTEVPAETVEVPKEAE